MMVLDDDQYPLGMTNIANWKISIFSGFTPTKKIDSYLKLPEGSSCWFRTSVTGDDTVDTSSLPNKDYVQTASCISKGTLRKVFAQFDAMPLLTFGRWMQLTSWRLHH